MAPFSLRYIYHQKKVVASALVAALMASTAAVRTSSVHTSHSEQECLWCEGPVSIRSHNPLVCHINRCLTCPYPTVRTAVDFYKQTHRFACQICYGPNNPRFFVSPSALNDHYTMDHSNLCKCKSAVKCGCGAVFCGAVFCGAVFLSKEEKAAHLCLGTRRRCQFIEHETNEQRVRRIKENQQWAKKADIVLKRYGF